MTTAASLVTIARAAAKGFLKSKAPSEQSVALRMVRSWHEHAKIGALMAGAGPDKLVEIKAIYTEACEKLGGIL